MKIKMYCVFAMESVVKMNGIRGKLGAQAGHGFLHAYWDSLKPGPEGDRNRFVERARAYRENERAYKICLVVDTVAELETLRERYTPVCGTALIKDAGFTVFAEPTVTCLGLGPLYEYDIGEDLADLKTLT